MQGPIVEWYWSSRKSLELWSRILRGRPAFRRVVLGELGVRSIRPVHSETIPRAAAALRWLFRAQDATPDHGVSYGYFPASSAGGWDVSYPETTGYIMTSLVNYGRRAGWAEPIERAHRMALWEADTQMVSGAVQGGKLTTPDKQTPAAFNTGMVLDGLVSVLEERKDPRVLVAAERAANFLADDLRDD